MARPGQANASRTWSAMKNDENFNMSIRHVEGIRCPGQRCRAGGAAGRLQCRAGGAAGASMPGRWRAREAMPGAAGTKPPNPHSPPLAIRAICAIWVSQGKPLNIHSPPAPCYMCYMCYMALYSTYYRFSRVRNNIAHI